MVKIQAQTMLPATPQRTAEALRVAPTPTMAPVMVCVVDTGMPSAGGQEQRERAAGLGTEAAHRLELGDALAHGLDDAPAAEQRAQADGDVAGPDHPGGRHLVAGRRSPEAISSIQMMPMVFCASLPPWPRLYSAGRHQLQAAEPAVHPQRECAGRSRPPPPSAASPAVKPSAGETKMKATAFQMPAAISLPCRPWR
jgi:hypothetical protein